MNSIWAFFLLAFAAGFCLPTQAGINTQLNQWSQSAILAAMISFAVGTIGLFCSGDHRPFRLYLVFKNPLAGG